MQTAKMVKTNKANIVSTQKQQKSK